jgi:hypothetical protein
MKRATPEIQVQNLDHLGIVAGMIDEIGLVEQVEAMGMALCLLVYTLAQRKLRQALSETNTCIPNQLAKMTDTPTMQWVFQCFQAIHLVVFAGHKQVSNLSPQRLKILQFLGAACGRYYLLE